MGATFEYTIYFYLFILFDSIFFPSPYCFQDQEFMFKLHIFTQFIQNSCQKIKLIRIKSLQHFMDLAAAYLAWQCISLVCVMHGNKQFKSWIPLVTWLRLFLGNAVGQFDFLVRPIGFDPYRKLILLTTGQRVSLLVISQNNIRLVQWH